MCTEPHPAACDAAEKFLASNPGDPTTYPTVSALEDDAVELLGEITGLREPRGYVASGGTEANVQAVWAARNLAETDDPNVVASESAHFRFQKATEVLGAELRLATIDAEHRADTEAVAELVDGDTVLVVGIAGTTEYGRVDPIPASAGIAHNVEALFHVDAAWGGFMLPFTDRDWHFEHAAVDTRIIDPHKMGQAVILAGGFLAREKRVLDALAVETPYLESTAQATLVGTRSGAGVASAWAAMDAFWSDGYREQYERSQANAEWIAEAFESSGYDVVDPALPLVAADVRREMVEELQARGWRVSPTGSGEFRIVCMPHVTRSMLEEFGADLDSL